jgi:hypothetical protein
MMPWNVITFTHFSATIVSCGYSFTFSLNFTRIVDEVFPVPDLWATSNSVTRSKGQDSRVDRGTSTIINVTPTIACICCLAT